MIHIGNWRRSRWARALAKTPGLGAIPVSALELLLARAQRVHSMALEALLRIGAAARAAARLQCWNRPRLLLQLLSPRQPNSPILLNLEKPTAPIADSERSVAVYASSQGNFFFSEIADLLAAALQRAGFPSVERRDERDGPALDVDEHLVVAPHEFYGLGIGPRLAGSEFGDFRRSSTLFLAEQLGTKHYAFCLPFAAEARQVLDLDPRSAAFFRELGIDARFYPLGYVPKHNRFGPDIEEATDDLEERATEILFNGVLTRRRSEFFARHAGFFASRRCELVLPTPHRPLASDVPSTLTTEAAAAASRRAKVLLNIHRDDHPYFEWHRIVVRGLWHRCLVVSEPCHRVPGLVPGVHYLEVQRDEIPERLAWLLDTSEGKSQAEQIRAAGHRALREDFDAAKWARQIWK